MCMRRFPEIRAGAGVPWREPGFILAAQNFSN
jgi:hypothetical protein